MALTFRDLRADEIDCRIATVTEKGLSLLLYKDARCDMIILDETVGAYNWQREHSRDNANCKVSIWDEDKKQWISKEDTGTESNTEAAKGLASDSFKRACFNWGIGRELYTAPYIWVGSDKANIKEKGQGKYVSYDKFSVKEITITDKKITGLAIYSETRKQIVYTFGKTENKVEKQQPKQQENQQPVATSKPKEAQNQTPATAATTAATDPEMEKKKKAYQQLIDYCKENKVDLAEVCKANGLTKESSAVDFEIALVYARTIMPTGGDNT